MSLFAGSVSYFNGGLAISRQTYPRVIPFALFVSFIGIEEIIRFFTESGVLLNPCNLSYFLYPIKTVATGIALLYFWPRYDEIRSRDYLNFSQTALSVLAGLLVFSLWVLMDWDWATFGKLRGYDPTVFPDSMTRSTLIGFRLAGASIVVPIMEELFWRSFLVRYLIDHDFMKVGIGRFTATSCIVTIALFGLEHNFWLSGIMAGTIYTLLLYRTKSIAQCILSHAVTNFSLGVYVLNTGTWHFW